MTSATKTARKGSKLRKSVLTLATVGALGVVGAFASTAALSDEATFDVTAAHGATLDINETAPGTFKIGSVENTVPYTVANGVEGWQTGVLTVKNDGSTSGVGKLDISGTDGYNCFEHYIAVSNPANGWHGVTGNQWGGPSPATASSIDLGTLAAGATRSYKFALRMKGSCTQGSGLDSGGTAAIGSRHANHAQASLFVKATIKQS
ncbi:MAG: hypothetical protein JWM25_1253 [Thermoleophilia bacterium]|nr:hypothetical protein [Thermoleophilia bacterium]MCZ4496670.1 hypothetical protein [Thermoleophilia bacterium]